MAAVWTGASSATDRTTVKITLMRKTVRAPPVSQLETSPSAAISSDNCECESRHLHTSTFALCQD
ncbi:UNVERIFIED_CONTAM: hypothetical protein FKN15_038690 [Acipenser sinensis]